jgi:hypothetical protein
MAAAFDETTQSFTKGPKPLQTSVYRLYPASKSKTVDFDDDIANLNQSVAKLFAAQPGLAKDPRRFYKLVGAVWLDNPSRDFQIGKAFRNSPEQDPDVAGSVVAGEDRLSSTAMESFTQSDPDLSGEFSGAPNCFACHDTKSIFSDKTGEKLMKPKKLNVSHVLSKFILESGGAGPTSQPASLSH